MRLLGISGTNGAGKDSAGEYLAAKHGWCFISVSDILREEAKSRGLPPDRHSTHLIGAEWRRQSGMGVLLDKAVDKYKAQGGDEKYNGLAISSLRNPGEADEVHKLGGQVVWIDAEPKVRYQRAVGRSRGPDDMKSFEEFITEEQHQMHHSGDKATLNMAGVKAKADIFLDTTENDINKLYKELEETLHIQIKL